MSDVVLSAGVRQNLLALQSTADLMSLTQNRLATGKKVNSALDNPGNFFTSQSLNNRASDLNSLLDSIGQAQKTIEAADQGITSLTKLVESAKSIAKQALQAPQPGSATYSPSRSRGNPTDEALGTACTARRLGCQRQTYSFDTRHPGGAAATTVDVHLDGSATYAEILAGLQSSFATALAAQSYDRDRRRHWSPTAPAASPINALDADAADFIDRRVTADTRPRPTAPTIPPACSTTSARPATTLTVAVNGGANQVDHLRHRRRAKFPRSPSCTTKLDTLDRHHRDRPTTRRVDDHAELGHVAELAHDHVFERGADDRARLRRHRRQHLRRARPRSARRMRPAPACRADFNNILTQIDALAADASYNGINLLDGDDLKVVFNETGSSFLTITGVTFNAAGLGLDDGRRRGLPVRRRYRRHASPQVDAALKTLRTQASAFGSNLTTVQTRQDFTKNLINTLQTGADNLVLADTNEEGANMLALQTRQQLSTTALSLSAQADQAVLRLFG